jgi:toxin ParE1/3/4
MLEMDEIAAFIQQRSPRSALRFLEAVETTCQRLLRFPEFGAVYETVPRTDDLRVCLVSGFEKHLVFYRIRKDEIHIERVVNGTRDLPSILKEGK